MKIQILKIDMVDFKNLNQTMKLFFERMDQNKQKIYQNCQHLVEEIALMNQ